MIEQAGEAVTKKLPMIFQSGKRYPQFFGQGSLCLLAGIQQTADFTGPVWVAPDQIVEQLLTDSIVLWARDVVSPVREAAV